MKKFVLPLSLSCLLLLTGFSITAESKVSNRETNEDYLKGKKLYDEKKFTEAFPFFIKAAEAGNSDAMMHLGKMYYNGWGVVHNHETGHMWHEKAAKLGNEESIRKLKTMDLHEKTH